MHALEPQAVRCANAQPATVEQHLARSSGGWFWDLVPAATVGLDGAPDTPNRPVSRRATCASQVVVRSSTARLTTLFDLARRLLALTRCTTG